MVTTENTIACPFKILIDSAEQSPLSFAGMNAGAAKRNRTYLVETEWRSLGRFPHSYGDYSVISDTISGMKRCHVERKSMSDAQGTILGFGDGERCTLRSYSVAGHPIYSRPGGGTFTLLPRKRVVPKAALYAPVKVKLPTQQLSGIVVKRNPLRIRITDRNSELYGCILEKPRYRAVEKEGD